MNTRINQTSELNRNTESARDGRATKDEVRLGRTQNTDESMQRMNTMRNRLARPGTQTGDRNEDLRRALNALPRDGRGTITPDLLVDEGKTASLNEVIERLVLEGLGSGADIAFEHAVNSLFADYDQDLALDEYDLAKARDLMLKEVRDVVADTEVRPWDPNEPAPAAADLESTITMLQDKVLLRRRMMLEASGDLSRVLSELTVSARAGDSDDLNELGRFLERFGQAVRARSAKSIKDHAKAQLLSTQPLQTTAPGHLDWGSDFLDRLDERKLG